MTAKEKEKLYQRWANTCAVRYLFNRDGDEETARDYLFQIMGMNAFLTELGLYSEFVDRRIQEQIAE